MTTVALSHGYPPIWNMGGEVALHRAMTSIKGEKIVLTKTEEEYVFEGVTVKKIATPDVLNIKSNPIPISKQLQQLDARVMIAQNELSLPGVLAANEIGAVSIVNVHTPPKYGRTIAQGMRYADYAVYNTQTAAQQWGEPKALVLHPPISPLPKNTFGGGDAYTLLSSLTNKGVDVVLKLAEQNPDKRFIVVRSPAESTHGLANIEERARQFPNLELHPRVPPEEVYKYFEQTRILLAPSRYETYGMSAIEAAGYGIPCVHVDTPHVREGIGEAAVLVPPLNTEATANGIDLIEANYDEYSHHARARAEWLQERQELELERFSDFIEKVEKPRIRRTRQRIVSRTTIAYQR
jgi:glycosyltransferase involved in cell wall biosynthesis